MVNCKHLDDHYSVLGCLARALGFPLCLGMVALAPVFPKAKMNKQAWRLQAGATGGSWGHDALRGLQNNLSSQQSFPWFRTMLNALLYSIWHKCQMQHL